MIVPVFNDAAYLSEALESILGQTLVPAGIIVVDDGSTDESASVAQGFTPQIRFERQDHAGAGAARNRGAALARSPLLAFLDADDIWRADKLKLQLRAFTDTPALEMVFAHLEHFHSAYLSPEQAIRRRIHGANTGLQRSGDRASYARIAKALLERRRAAARAKADWPARSRLLRRAVPKTTSWEHPSWRRDPQRARLDHSGKRTLGTTPACFSLALMKQP